MRVTFYEPAIWRRETVRDALALAGVQVSAEVVGRWTKYELLLAFDWAIREHMRAADNTSVRRRPKPSFLSP